ncbi:unnamed protein product, partial [Rotaria magnacalcarata]
MIIVLIDAYGIGVN